jgi:hypothetical protein
MSNNIEKSSVTLGFEFIAKILKQEKDHEAVIHTKWGNSVFLIEQAIGVLSLTLDSLGELEWRKFKWEDRHIINLASKSLGTACCTFFLLLKGYYSEGGAITRMLVENWVRMAFLAIIPEKGERVFKQTEFKVGNIKQELKFDISPIYKVLSYPVHGDKARALDDLVKHSQGEIPGFRIGIQYEEKHISLLVTQILFNLWVTWEVILARFTPIRGNLESKKEISKARRAVEEFLFNPKGGEGLLQSCEEVKKCLVMIGEKNSSNPFHPKTGQSISGTT